MQGTPSACAAHAAASPALPPEAHTTRSVGPCVASARCIKSETPRYLNECDGWRFWRYSFSCCVRDASGRGCTHLGFEVDGVFVLPEARGEVAGENEGGFRPEMALGILDRHGLRWERTEDYPVCCVFDALMTRVEPALTLTLTGPNLNTDAVRNPTINYEDAART